MTGLALPFKLSFQWLLNTFWKDLQSDVLPTPNTFLKFIQILFIFHSSETWAAHSKPIHSMHQLNFNGLWLFWHYRLCHEEFKIHTNFIQTLFKFHSSLFIRSEKSLNQIQSMFITYLNRISMDFENQAISVHPTIHL